MKLTPFRQALLKHADGTKTYEELAELTGHPPKSINVTLVHMRQAGYPVYVWGQNRVYRDKTYYDWIVKRRKKGMTWAEIGAERGYTAMGISREYRTLHRMFGKGDPDLSKLSTTYDLLPKDEVEWIKDCRKQHWRWQRIAGFKGKNVEELKRSYRRSRDHYGKQK